MPVAPLLIPAPPAVRPRVHCPACRRSRPVAPDPAGRWPGCCGWPMLPVLGPEPAEDGEAELPPDEEPDPTPADRRRWGRRAARRGGRAEVRLGWLGVGPDFGGGLVDVSAAGVQVCLRRAVRTGERVLVGLTPAAGPRPVLRTAAEVRWCVRDPGGMVRAGVRLARPLDVTDLRELVE